MGTNFSPSVFNYLISRFSLCLIFLIVIGHFDIIPGVKASNRDVSINNLPQISPYGLSESDWQNIFGVLHNDDESDACYPLVVDDWLQLAHVFPGSGNYTTRFGYSVAIDGDTVVVGAYWDRHHDTTGAGTAYVFDKPAAGWSSVTQTAMLTASDYSAYDTFGLSVAIDGDTIVVGAPDDGTGPMTSHGSAYVFVKPGSKWVDMTQNAKLTASDKAISDRFGRHMAISGDTVVSGVDYDDVGSNENQGSAYVFSKPESGWIDMTETAHFTASDGIASDGFGASTAISGTTILVSAYAHNNGHGVGSGQVYVFEKSDDWVSGTENARLTASDTADHEYFGWATAIDGDVAVIGAPGETTFDNTGEDSVYIFLKPGGGWSGDLTETAILTATDGSIQDNFGYSVAIGGDNIVVGAPYDDIGMDADPGSAYVFSKPTGGWVDMTETAKLIADSVADFDYFGFSVGVSGDTAVIGAWQDDMNIEGDNVGSAYIFSSYTPLAYIYLPVLIR